LVHVRGIEIWMIPRDITTMNMKLEVYISSWEMLRPSPIGIEAK
jgi:hypothetical protein